MSFENYIYLMIGVAIGFFAAIPIVVAWRKTDAEDRMDRHTRELDEYDPQWGKHPDWRNGKLADKENL